jgi:endoglucanase
MQLRISNFFGFVCSTALLTAAACSNSPEPPGTSGGTDSSGGTAHGAAGGSAGTSGAAGKNPAATGGTTGGAGTTGTAGQAGSGTALGGRGGNGGSTGGGGGSTSGTGSSFGGNAPGGNGGVSGGMTGGANNGGANNGGATAGTSAGGRGGAAGAASGGRGGQGGTANGGAAGTSGSAGAGDTVNAGALVAAMGFGANIGNTLENTTTWETGWGQPLITQQFVNGMASRGIKSIRLPVAWNTYATNGVIDATKMDRVKQVVGWILDAGMYVIVNIHWDGGWIDNEGNSNQYKLTDDVKTKFKSYWQQIGTAFASVGNKLIFEGLNEEGRYYVNGDINGTPDYAALNTLNQLFVTTIRAQGGYNAGRALLIAGFNTDLNLTCVDGFTMPTDPAGTGKLFLSIHYYNPWTFCGLDTVESWGSPATTWGTSAEKTALQNDFTKLVACSSQKKAPIILGEFGVTKGEAYPRQSASRILWMESVAKAALTSGVVVPVLWDTATDISRTDGSFDTELQTVMNDIK